MVDIVFGHKQMTRILIDQSHNTHIQTCILHHTNNYTSTQIMQTHWTNIARMYDHILLEDDGFDRIVTKLSRYTSEPCSITQFKSIINREIALGKLTHPITTQIMTFLINNTKVNKQQRNAPRGETGTIECDVQLILLKSKALPKHIINDCKKGLLSIVPKSLYTIELLNENDKSQTYTLLYLYEHVVKLITIHQGQYEQIEYLNRGLKELKNMMIDMSVEAYYYPGNCKNLNQLSLKLINQSTEQYVKILGNRIAQYTQSGSKIAIVNQLSDHPIIHQFITDYISTTFDYYVIQCSALVPRISKHLILDGQIYLNHINKD